MLRSSIHRIFPKVKIECKFSYMKSLDTLASISTLSRPDKLRFLTVPQKAEQAMIFERNLTSWKTNIWKQQFILHCESNIFVE